MAITCFINEDSSNIMHGEVGKGCGQNNMAAPDASVTLNGHNSENEPSLSSVVSKNGLKASRGIRKRGSLASKQNRNSCRPAVTQSSESLELPVFDARGDDFDALDWLETVQRIRKDNDWTKQAMMKAVWRSLSGPAKDWLHSCDPIPKTWKTFALRFRQQFIGNESDMRNQLSGYTQGTDEDTLEYVLKKIKKCKLLRLSLEETRFLIVQGLQSRELCYFLFAKEHKNINHFLKDLKDFERLTDARIQLDKPQPANSLISNFTSAFTKDNLVQIFHWLANNVK